MSSNSEYRLEAIPPVLEVQELTVTFATSQGSVVGVDRVSFALQPGECLALVGESGSGKSTAALAVAGLIEAPGIVSRNSSVVIAGEETVGIHERRMRQLRGSKIGVVFQDPTSALNPVYRIARQIGEAVRAHERIGSREVAERVRTALGHAGIPANALERVERAYPHELSGGLQQRCAIAMAIVNHPAVIIADEPTTALDATVQLEVLDSLGRLKDDGVAIVFITHDLSVAERLADRIAVMYAGQVVECQQASLLLSDPGHPYTRALIACAPSLEIPEQRLEPIPGDVPSARNWGPGCRFAERCPHVLGICRTEDPPMMGDRQGVARCWLLAAPSDSESLGFEGRVG